MCFEFAISTLAVLTALIPAYSLPVGLWLSIVLLLASAVLLWSVGMELLGWLMLIVYVGALAILFLFVVMLLDLGVPQVPSEASWLRFAWYALPGALEGPMGHSSSPTTMSLNPRPSAGEWVSLAYLYHGCPEVVILLGCLLTLGLFGAAVVPAVGDPVVIATLRGIGHPLFEASFHGFLFVSLASTPDCFGTNDCTKLSQQFCTELRQVVKDHSIWRYLVTSEIRHSGT